MNEPYFEIDYEIEAAFDMQGEFPLQCAALLFNLLEFNRNIVIKNQYSIKAEKANVIAQYVVNDQNYFFEWHRHPEGNYCMWIKNGILTNQEIVDILKLQGTYLSYIVPSNSFDWNKFLGKWKEDERYLLLSGQSPFICNVVDMDRTLNINFSTTVFSTERIIRIISEWENAINHIAEPSKVKKTETQMRTKYGHKYRVQLCFCS